MTRAEILTTGDELLRGDVVNTNAAWLGARLQQLGVELGRGVTVGDGLASLEAAVGEAVTRTEILLVSGGLGPTDDDRTTEAVARAAGGLPLEIHAGALDQIRERFARAGFPYTPNNEKQAYLPRGAELLPNPHGTAPGFMLEIGTALVFCMPGVPLELKPMFDDEVAPRIRSRHPGLTPARIRSLNCFGLGESQIDHRLCGLEEAVPGEPGLETTFHYRASFPEVRVVLVVRARDAARESSAAALLARLEAEARARLGVHLYGVDETSFSDALVAALKGANATVAFAESCTGGLCGDLITRASGSSEVFELGVVTYSNAFKTRMVGVPEEVLARHGAVSRECVEAMALGVRALAGASYGVAVSGIAGPGGGTPEKPVGTVHFALASEQGVRHLERVFPFDRQRVKQLSAYTALALVLHELRRSEGDPLSGRYAASAGTPGRQP
jgi:nicotinamide-nucleotide amidase